MSSLSKREKKNLRRKLFVNKTIQGRALVHLAVYWGIYHVVLWHAMFVYRYFEYYRGVLNGDQMETFGALYGDFIARHTPMMLCAVALFPIIFYDMLKFTHRVAGPLVRFNNALKALAEGRKVARIKTRDGDLLNEFQDTFNEFLERTGRMAPDESAHADSTAHANSAEDHAGDQRVLEELQSLGSAVASRLTSAEQPAADAAEVNR